MLEAVLSLSLSNVIARQPRLQAILNDSIVLAPYDAQVTHHCSYAASSYRMQFALTDNTQVGTADWSDIEQAKFKVQVSTSSLEPYADLIEGYADTISISPVAGSVSVEGRDLSASLLDSKTPADYQNSTASEIVRILAGRHGLNPVVVDAADFAGRSYANTKNVTSLVQFARLTSDWDILAMLAQSAGVDLFVIGSSLYFQTRGTASTTPQTILFNALTDLRLNKHPRLAAGTAVTVSSWNSATGAAVAETKGTSSTSNYSVSRPNIASTTAQAMAAQLLQSIAREAMSVQFTMPGDAVLSAQCPIRLEGTGTAFDTTYTIDSITRAFHARSGFSQTIRAKMLAQS